MLARSVLRIAGRQAFRPAAFAVPIQRATFRSTSKNDDPDVPVVSYQDGQRTEESLFVNPNRISPVSPQGVDVQKSAVPLNPNVYPQLTPTLSKFTLPGKVAIVTG